MSEPAPTAGYPGNLSLPVEVREKILSTFRHTLDLYRDGKIDDCLIGCDFILKMDPRFAPARKLQEKAHNPKAEVDVDELAGVLTAGVSGPSRASASFATAPADVRANEFGGPESGALENLSLDSLSLDGPLPDLATPGGRAEPGLPFHADAGGDALFGLSEDPALATPAVTPEQEIEALLKQGDDAQAAGDPQQAIEIWSRIFLIDINHAEAVERIEKARAQMAEESRRVAAALQQGEESFAKGDLAAARTQFDAVLSLGETPAAAAAAPPVPPGPVTAPLPPHDLSVVAAPGDVLAEELDQSGPPGGRRSWTSIPRPPREGQVVAAPTGAAAVSKRFALPTVPPRIAMIAGAALVVVAVGLFFLLRSPEEAPAARPESGPTLEHATQLFREGKIEETTAELRQIPREHPDYARAQKLLASLTDDKESDSARPATESVAPPPGETSLTTGDPAALRAEAERALREKRYIDALKTFSLAAPHFPGDPTFSQEMAAASEKVSELTPAVKLYNDGEYETAIPILWRIFQASRDNQDARSYLLRSYYNQGILQLQNGLYDRAHQSFGEVLALDSEDVESARHRQFAERYRSGDLDLLGRIYVRYISPRP